MMANYAQYLKEAAETVQRQFLKIWTQMSLSPKQTPMNPPWLEASNSTLRSDCQLETWSLYWIDFVDSLFNLLIPTSHDVLWQWNLRSSSSISQRAMIFLFFSSVESLLSSESISYTMLPPGLDGLQSQFPLIQLNSK